MKDGRLGILQVSTADVAGGAERVALQLHLAYRDRGLDARLAVGQRSTDLPGIVELDDEVHRGRVNRLLRSGLAGTDSRSRWLLDRAMRTLASPRRMLDVQLGREDFDHPSTANLLAMAPPNPAVLHLHNLHGGYFDLRELPHLSTSMPTVVTLHDSWLFTGHCGHPIDCDRWRSGCGECPDLDILPAIRRDATAFNLERKRSIYQKSVLHVAAPSDWLLGLARESVLAQGMADDSRIIPNGVDTDIFKPGDRIQARAALGLAHDANVVVFAAASLVVNPFKDFATLREAIAGLQSVLGESLVLIALGSEAPGEGALPGVRYVPFVREASDVARYYHAADVYAHPALAESFGLSIVEAMACGLPVVATNVGGIPEVVADGLTGVLVPPRDAPAMSRALERLLRDPTLRRSLGGAGLRRAHERYRLEAQVDAYLGWYAELLFESPSA